MVDMELPRHIKPRRASFLFPRVIGAFVLALVVGTALAVGLTIAGVLPLALAIGAGLLVGLLPAAFAFYSATVAYEKEEYEIHAGHLVCKRGGIFSDERTELDIRNITHVKQRLPWLRFRLFGVGDVRIESAGSGDSEIEMVSVYEPDETYDLIRQLMMDSGYSLKRGELLHEEQPDHLGVVLECIGLFIGVLIAIAFALAELFFSGSRAASGTASWIDLGLALLGLIGIPGTIFALVIHYLDLKRRTYQVYDDTVVYKEGFLTRDNAFIPYENIADANSKQNFLDMILGLYDVQVSCQGSGSEIRFRRLKRGPELTDVIDSLVQQASAKKRAAPVLPAAGSPEAAAPLGLPSSPATAEPDFVAPEHAWTADLKMDMGRAVVPMLWTAPVVVPLLYQFIVASSTRYSIRPSSVKSAFRFLNSTERDFSYDKITGLVVKTTPWDYLFKTVTVRLWSIGAPDPLDLQHIPRDQLDLDALLRQVGIPTDSPTPYAPETRFGLGALARAEVVGFTCWVLFFLGVLLLAALVHPGFLVLALLPLPFVGLRYLYQHHYYKRQAVAFHERHVTARTGLFWVSRYYVRYGNVKRIQLTRYPGSQQGALQVFVAGEQRIQQGQKAGQPADGTQPAAATIPYAFTAGYLTDIPGKQRLLDDFLLGRVAPTPDARPAEPLEVFIEGQPAVGNTLVKVGFISLVTIVGILLLPVLLPLAAQWVKRWRYRVEAGRIVASWGLLFEQQESVTFDSIDSLKQGQGPIGKLFGNGGVTILTAGSSSPDLVLADLADYQAFYDTIRPHYGKR